MLKARDTERRALVLQGGGALGAYQAGVYQALEEVGEHPEWIAGISIGAINAAIIAGNPVEQRMEKLKGFWDRITEFMDVPPLIEDGFFRRMFNEWSGMTISAFGVPGFFTPRFPPAPFSFPGTPGAISFYDTAPLRETLMEFVDFDRINSGPIRLSLGAVHVRTGNFTYFDNSNTKIGPDHVMASGALPPGFPPVWIDGEAYWDGGLVSNTPLQYVLDRRVESDSWTVYQVDLFSSRGEMPCNMLEVFQRDKDIRYSSRTRMNTDIQKELIKLREAAQRLYEKLPSDLKEDKDAKLLSHSGKYGGVTVMHLINRSEDYDTHSKDYDFSRVTVQGHWKAGYDDAAQSLKDKRWIDREPVTHGISVFDLVTAD